MSIGRTRRRLGVVCAAGVAMAALLPSAGAASASSPAGKGHGWGWGWGGRGEVIFSDSFDGEFGGGVPGEWRLFENNAEFPLGDGIISTDGGELSVVPMGTNPETGEPAFSYTEAQQDDGGLGASDHLKWVTFPDQWTEEGHAGFTIPEGGSVACETRMSAVSYGVEDHPFGDAVSDAGSDPRLAGGTMITGDFESGVLASFLITNERVWAIYERLRLGQEHAGYSFAIPVARTSPGREHELEIRYDRGGDRINWIVDGWKRLATDDIGTHAFDRDYMLLDAGGVEQETSVDQFTCGMGIGTSLDSAEPGNPDGTGLVKLDSTENFYFDPREGQPALQQFVDNESLPENRLWGQGTEINVDWYRVTRRD
ncbi:DUF6081 family protein [Streptomyces sp. 4N509B]|uniref:DUF6081 family protein n=1 Tax=Streptomyces sp. 4N509B TaxID=3457413 RepID=UPI003FCFB7FD